MKKRDERVVEHDRNMAMAPGWVRPGRVEERQGVRSVSRGGCLERRCAYANAAPCQKRGETKPDVGRKSGGGAVSPTKQSTEGFRIYMCYFCSGVSIAYCVVLYIGL